jgi:hypothetical protein
VYDLSKALTNSIVDLGSNFILNDIFQINPSSDPTTTYTWSWAPLTPGSFKTISSQTTSTLNFGAADVPKIKGYYNFVMKNKNGTTALRFRILSFAAPTSTYANLPPAMTITTQPFPVTIGAGGVANFGVVVNGSPIVYTWYKGGTVMSTNGSPFFTLSPAVLGHAGDYFVVATDAFNRTVESTHVHLTVVPLGE